ncbi:hypothetical protein [Micromonospora kangleipakensis]|uniref:hypothetical protein n=1 Tax=Micromonospora kangleipakensis TaxID=1077942 RepID=UPI0013EF4EB0|nr:hypothetical protein [Micromonospora kangleipakensis]
MMVSIVVMLGAQVYRYRRRSTVEERVRTRWPVLATVLAVAGFAVTALVDDGRVGEGSELSIVVASVLGVLPSYGFAVALAAPTLTNVDAALRNVRAARLHPSGELVAQRKNLDVLVGIARRQQPDEGEHARQRQVGQSQ